MTIAVLGAGMVGQAIATDLAASYDVTSFDLDKNNLGKLCSRNPAIKTVAADLLDYNSYTDYLQPFDLVITAVPGFMGYKTLEAVINAGKDVVDISFFPEDALDLDDLAKRKEVTAITDCGVAPGMSNLILGRYNEEMKIRAFECYVGGLPVDKKPPFFYKAPFSPIDVIQEYIRPARLVENGEIVIKPAMSDREILSFGEIGSLEAFNTDGLRSLVCTMKHISDMKEKTLRYPGHVVIMEALQQAGFFDTHSLRINETDITPLEFTSRLLMHQWKLCPGENEFTVMKVILRGAHSTVVYDLLDWYDPVADLSSMARTTGFTCTAAANLVIHKKFNKKGVFPPELIGSNKECFDYVLAYLEERRVKWEKTIL